MCRDAFVCVKCLIYTFDIFIYDRLIKYFISTHTHTRTKKKREEENERVRHNFSFKLYPRAQPPPLPQHTRTHTTAIPPPPYTHKYAGSCTGRSRGGYFNPWPIRIVRYQEGDTQLGTNIWVCTFHPPTYNPSLPLHAHATLKCGQGLCVRSADADRGGGRMWRGGEGITGGGNKLTSGQMSLVRCFKRKKPFHAHTTIISGQGPLVKSAS